MSFLKELMRTFYFKFSLRKEKNIFLLHKGKETNIIELKIS